MKLLLNLCLFVAQWLHMKMGGRVLKGCKEQIELDKLALEKEKERAEKAEHDHEVALALRDAMRERVKELEGRLKMMKEYATAEIDLRIKLGDSLWKAESRIKELEKCNKELENEILIYSKFLRERKERNEN